MKTLRFAIAAGMLATLAAPAAAQHMSTSHEFLKAVRDRDGNKVTELLESANVVNLRDDRGETALTIVVARRDETWTEFLLGKGADPNLPAKGGDTALIIAARVGFAEAVDLLLRAGARVDATNRMGETALIVAVQHRQVPVVKALLAAGANPDRTDTAAGFSARDYAARDTRSRQLLELIEAKKPKPAAAAAR